MRNEILSEGAKKKVFYSPDAMELIMSNSHPVEFANTVLACLANDTARFVSKKDIEDAITGDKLLFQCAPAVKPRNKIIPDIHVIKGTDITGQSTCEGKINDFAKLIMNRYQSERIIIEGRGDFGRAGMIEKVKNLDRSSKIIGIIYEIRKTKNGHTMITLEDESGVIKVFISKDSPLSKEILVNDEVIGVEGKMNSSKAFFVATRIVFPDIPGSHTWEVNDSYANVAFMSDIHVGNKLFMQKSWSNMAKWLKENHEKMDINYIVIPGDVIDGIGVYPDQDADLVTLDIYKQYGMLADILKDIPDDILVAMSPGNHDGMRLAEPQPAFNKSFTEQVDSNVIQTGNPICLDIEGRTIQTYHGKSFDDWIPAVPDFSYDNPIEVMKCMCKKRHLAPIYGERNALAPEFKDYMVMNHVPDIFCTGHIHKVGQGIYKGVRLINSSCFMGQSDFQKMHALVPEPAILTLVNLGTGNMKVVDFKE